jgi:Mg-chelatase subunit ChlD
MRFLRLELAWWLIPALAGLLLVRWRMRRQYAASTTVRWLNDSSFRASLLRRLPIAVLFAGLLLTMLALMDPVVRHPEAVVQSRGRDIVMVLDVSMSMQTKIPNLRLASAQQTGAIDNGVTRLDAVKSAMRSFVLLRHDDRIALVLFSNNPYVVCPLTFDYSYLLQYIDMVDRNSIEGEGSTAIGDALVLTDQLLAKQSNSADRRHQLIVLFTDGENNRGSDPVDALTALNAEDIHVDVVGINLDKNNEQVQRFLQAVYKYDGHYFDATTAGEMDSASHMIDSLEPGLLVNKVYDRDWPVYDWFAIPALVCLVAAIALRALPFFVDQT